MKVLIAFDKFKDSMTAQEACAVAARAVRATHAGARVIEAPLSDGGEGFCEILTSSRAGDLTRIAARGPHFEDIEAQLGYVELQNLDPEIKQFLAVPESGRLAVIEMAQASGLELVPVAKRDPWVATTYGVGQLLRKAAADGADAILLGIGGSATNDLGLGALEALGLRFIDQNGETISDMTPAKWESVVRLDGEACSLPCIRIACDVSNPLLGPRGAAATYGPQKGLKPEDLQRMEAEMQRMAQLLCDHCGEASGVMQEPSSGAAGGIGFGLRVACSARYVPGFELVWSWLALNDRLKACDVLITGEGRFDRSSLQGKGPGTLLRTAADMGKQVRVFAGRVDRDLLQDLPPGFSPEFLVEISPRELPLEQALREAPLLLESAVKSCI